MTARPPLSARLLSVAATLLAVLALAACGADDGQPTFVIAGIPDQNVSILEARFNNVAAYLSEETGLNVRYVPVSDYSTVVTAFKQGDIQLAWYGGLTGVQARLAVPEAQALAQRPRDAEFHSVFVAAPDSGIATLADLDGRSLTFGSESSTSGHLMPRFYLSQAGIDPESDLSTLSFSGSHDITWKLVEQGAFDAGALAEAVWDARVAAGAVDLSRVEVFFRTPAFFDYHWVINRDIEERYGTGTMERVRTALLGISAPAGGAAQEIAEAFQTDSFVATDNANYTAIEAVARSLGIVE